MSAFHNRTRRSASIPRTLLRERKPYLIPLYYLQLTSELAREGIRNSGSYRFADHFYANRPRGRFLIGRLLDRLLLGLPSARAFRSRYLHAKQEIHRLVRDTAATGAHLDILAVPSGYARELVEVAAELRTDDEPGYRRVSWYGLDLDGELVATLMCRSRESGHQMSFWAADALSAESYPRSYDLIISLGFTEFLDDDQVVRFFGIVREHLKAGGRFVTSGMRPHRLSDYLLRNVGELHTSYRSARYLRRLCERTGFGRVSSYDDRTGLQTMVIACKE